MKKYLVLFPTALLFSIFISYAQVQDWQNIASFPDARSGAVSFVIEDTAYVGLGISDGSIYHKDFYKYNSNDNSWQPIADLPGVARNRAVAFVINGKAYVGSGDDGSSQYKDFYEYNPSVGNWVTIADLPGASRSQASSFSINDKGYVGLGANTTGSLSDFFEYDPVAGGWSQIADLGSDQKRSRAIGFSAEGKGYIASGSGGSSAFTDLRSYDPITNSWTEEVFADSKLSSLQQNTVYTDSEGLVHILKSGSTQEQVIINPTDNSLQLGGSYFDDKRNGGVAFYLNGELYAGIGNIYDNFGSAVYQNDFRKLVTFNPPNAPSNLRKGNESGLRITWDDNSDNEDGFIIFLSEGDNQNYQVVDSTTLTYFEFDTLKQGVRQYLKVEAYNAVGNTESNEINYYPIYSTGVVTPPELLSVSEDQTDSLDITMEYTFINHDSPGYAVVERSDDGVNYETVLNAYTGQSDTITFTQNPVFNEYSEELFYRVKMTIEGREDSDYSNTVTFSTDELKPTAPDLFYEVREQRINIFSSVFKYKLTFANYNHADSITFYGMKSDTVNFSNTIKNIYGNEIITFELNRKEPIQILAINQNIFGRDTSKISIIAPLREPRFQGEETTNTNAIAFEYISYLGGEDGFTLVERATEEGDFVHLDSIPESGGFIIHNYYDLEVEPNTNYRYRLRAVQGNNASLDSDNILSAKSEKTISWPAFKDNTLNSLLDSLETYKMTNIDAFNDKVFFISASSKAAFYFDLDEEKLYSLPDVPTTDTLNHFSRVEILNNKVYYFTPLTEGAELIKSVFILNLESESWSVKNIDNIREVKYVTRFRENSFLTIIEKEDSDQGGVFAIYDTELDNLSLSALEINTNATYINVANDSILIFDEDKNVLSTNENLLNVNQLGTTNHVLTKDYITEVNNELVQVSNDRLFKIDLTVEPYLFEQEDVRIDASYANREIFSYNDQIVYFRGYGYKSFSYINSFVYRNEDVPGKLVGFAEVSGARQYENIEVTWVDSPNETYYIAKILERTGFSDSQLLTTDTLEENTTHFNFTGLSPETEYFVRVSAGNGVGLGEAGFLTVSTLNIQVPGIPQSLNLSQNSNDSIEVSWELSEPINIIDSIYLRQGINDPNPRFAPAIEIVSTGKNQSYQVAVMEENTNQFTSLYPFNKYARSPEITNSILTRLNRPSILAVSYFKAEAKYEILVQDQSEYEDTYQLYKKSADDLEFELVQTLDGAQSGEFIFEDFIDDPNIRYEYYLQCFKTSADSIYNSSFPSDTASTENAILSNKPLQSDQLSIFPNPVIDKIFIRSDLNVQFHQIEVLSLEGRLIKKFKASEIINVSELEKGIYLLKITAKSGEIVKRFIKE